jgi:hypothetical protein
MEKVKTNREYLSYIADRIFTEHSSSEVILNTMIDMEERGYARGYKACFADRRKFKEAQETRRKTSLNTIKDNISDRCSKAVEVTNEPNE